MKYAFCVLCLQTASLLVKLPKALEQRVAECAYYATLDKYVVNVYLSA